MDALVLYHYPCPDGIFAALAAKLYYQATNQSVQFMPNTVYAPLKVAEVAAQKCKTIYLLDFAGPQGFAEGLAQVAPRVIVLDHHKTAAESLPGPDRAPPSLHCLLDMNRSGATLAYDFFSLALHRSRATGCGPDEGVAGECRQWQERMPPGSAPREQSEHSSGTTRGRQGPGLVAPKQRERVEKLFSYIEDADLWRWALPASKGFSSGLNDLKLELSATVNANIFEQLLSLDPDHLICQGNASLAEKNRVIEDTLKSSYPLRLGGGQFGTCLAVWADGVAHLRSELGNQLAANSIAAGYRGMGAVMYTEAGLWDSTLAKVSLRSVGEEDTTPISEEFGGGGHKNASSFIVPKAVLEGWKA